MEIVIHNLADRADYLDIVSQWLWQEWGQGTTLEYRKFATRHNSQRDRVPMTFVATVDGQPAGTVSLWMNDLRSRQDLYPWMASLYVAPAMRGKGVSVVLQRHAIEEAKRLGYKHLYLFTDHVGFYEKFGWVFQEMSPMPNGNQVRIYNIEL